MRRMSGPGRVALLVGWLFVLGVAPPGRAGDDEGPGVADPGDSPPSREEVTKAFDELRPQLRQLGQFCTGNDLLLERSRIAETLFAFDPADATAREWLGHRRQKDGSWVAGPPRTFMNRPDGMKEFETRRAPVVAAVRKRLEPLLARCTGWEQAGLRGRIVRSLVSLVPEDAALRALHREVQVKGRWMLAESAATVAGRARVAAVVVAARETAAKLPREVVSAQDKGEWGIIVNSAGLEIRSSVTYEDTVAVGEAAQAARELFSALAGEPVEFRKNLRLYILRGPESSARFLDQCHEVPTADRPRLAKLPSYWLNRTEFVIAATAQAYRIEVAVRQTLDVYQGPFGPLVAAPAWLRHGLAAYVSNRLLATRAVSFVSRDSPSSDPVIAREAVAPGADWVQLTRKLIDRGVTIDLSALMRAQGNDITMDDTVVSCALAAYFAEGRPDELSALLRDFAGTSAKDWPRVFAETCGDDPEALQVRFLRWLREVPAK